MKFCFDFYGIRNHSILINQKRLQKIKN